MKGSILGMMLGFSGLVADNIMKLEEYVRQMKWENDDISTMMRSDTLLQMGDTRDLIYGMLHYRFHIDGVSDITPMNLLQYGCQCQIMTETSFGQSKDRLDEACVKWHQCRKCISMDEDLTIGQGQKKRNCSPKNDLYQIGVNVDTGELSCQLLESQCESTLCECDKLLVDNLMSGITDYDDNRNIASYIYKKDCKKPPRNEEEISSVITLNSGPSESRPDAAYKNSGAGGPNSAYSHHAEYDMCCGEYPNKKPFASRLGKRKCCGEKVFEWKRRECCDGNRLGPIGEC
jgi:hypothetical protein